MFIWRDSKRRLRAAIEKRRGHARAGPPQADSGDGGGLRPSSEEACSISFPLFAAHAPFFGRLCLAGILLTQGRSQYIINNINEKLSETNTGLQLIPGIYKKGD